MPDSAVPIDPDLSVHQCSDSPSIDATEYLALGDSSLVNYWTEGELDALSDAATYYRAALSEARQGSEEEVRAQIGLADALRLEVEEGTGGDECRAESVSLVESAVSTAGVYPALFTDATRALGEVLLDRSRRKTTERLQLAVDTFRQLVDLTSDSPPAIAIKSLALYAQSLDAQWRYTGDPELVDLAGAALDRATSMQSGGLPPSDHDFGFAFLLVCSARSAAAVNADDITTAIEMGEQVISRTPQRHPWLPKLWNILGLLYTNKMAFVGDIDRDHLQRLQLNAYSEARKMVRPGHSLWHVYNANYASALYKRFHIESNLDDLQEATAIFRNVLSQVAAAGYRHQSIWSIAGNLSELLCTTYAQMGNLEALDEAITLYIGVIDDAPLTYRPLLLPQMGRCYHTRYTAHGRIADLETAISLHEQALIHSTGPYVYFVEASIVLADSLLARFDQLGRPEDMEKAISVLRTAIDHPQQEHKDAVYSLLGHVLLKKGTATKNIEDVEESTRCQRKALDLFPEAHFERSISFYRLGLAERNLFAIDKRALAIQNSISAFSHAISLLPTDHPNRALYLLELATALFEVADTQAPELTIILGTLEEAALHAQSWPADRHTAAALWARTAHRAGRLTMALDAYRLAISILPQVAWLGLEDELRVQRLSHQPPDISQDAAACAIELGLYSLAVEIVEGSRSILWNTSQELRAELGKLREVAPDLAKELAQTNAALAARPSAAQDEQDEQHVESERRRIHRLATRRTELLHLVRSIPGFQRFLLPPTYELLRHASREGPVVIIISSIYRCAALILQHDKEVTLVPLLDVTHRLVLAQAGALQTGLRLTGDRPGREFLERLLLKILRDVWDKIGKPILLALDQQTYDRPLRRIWWCPTGAMTLLPIHACGPYNGQDPNMPDLVLSSHTPTLSALLRVQETDNSAQTTPPPRVLVISQPEFVNRPALPCALEEARVLSSVIPALCTFQIGRQATVAKVKEMLRDHTWLHVSSHGSQDSSKPLESCIALYDGDLKLSDVAQERIPNAEFAFLSACHSAKGTQSLPDEAMHLAAGMMFAGFKSVVATSWGIADKDAPVVAQVFYRHLVHEGKTPESTKTAEALHSAVKHLRDSGVPLHRWIPWVHLGA